MATKQQVAAVHDIHPDWTYRQVATALGCHVSYVRATAGRGGYRFAGTYEAREAKLRVAATAVLKNYAAVFGENDKTLALREALSEYDNG